MAKLERPRGLTINFSPSERQYELWNALQPNRCDKCGGILEMRPNGVDAKGHTIYQATCTHCGNTDIPEQILGGGAAGGGKALSIRELVLTPNGFKRMGDICVGDKVNTADGEIATVTAIHPQGMIPLWKLTTSDGIEVKCCENHIWKVVRYGRTIITDTQHLINWVKDDKNIEIPLCEAQPQSTKYDSFIHPYIIGVLLGDGGTTNNITITTPDDFIVKKVQSLLPDDAILKPINSSQYGWLIYNKKTDEHGYPYSPFKNEVIRLGMNCKSLEKRIPSCVMNGDINVRMACVQGLMDTDGYVDSRGHTNLSVCSKGLAEDFMYLVRSLGAKANMTTTVKSCVYKGERKYREAYTVWFNAVNRKDFVTLPKKQERIPDRIKSFKPRTIKSIEFAGIEQAQCITIDHPSGMFVTNGFLPTHNSFLGCCWLVYSCMEFSGIRMLVARKVRKTLLETTWNTLKDVLRSWGLKENVNYSINSQVYVITFWNGSTIMAMDLTPLPSDPDFNSLGSLEITGAFVDEVSEVSEKAIEVLASRIRYKIEDTFVVGKIFMSTNPCITWVRSTFVMTDDGDPVKLAKGYRYIPFSLFDNPNEKFRMIYFNKLSKIRDKATRDRLLYGNWWFIESNKMAAYWNFDGDKHLKQGVFESRYDPLKPLILSMDFNVNPYMTCLPMQIDYDNKKVYIFPEFIGRSKDKLNNTPAFTRHIAKKLVEWGHVGGVLLTGDPAGAARSTQTEEGVNNFTIATKNFTAANLRSTTQLLSKQPAQITRLEFVNELFKTYDGWSVEIDMRCHRLTEDFIYQQKNPDGTKEKKKIQMEDGSRAERYGHASDCFDYALVYYLSPLYDKYKSGTSSIIVTVNPDEIVYNEFDY